MAIRKIDPLRDLARLQEQMNRLFDETSARTLGPVGSADEVHGWKPPVDLVEEPDRYLLLADIPGVAAAELKIHVEKGVLRVEGVRIAPSRNHPDSFLRVERRHGPFSLAIYLPPSADPGAIKAAYRAGVLEISLPKKANGAGNRLEISLEE